MCYLVYEQDPFVRADICEALSTEFAGKDVVGYETLEGLKEGLSVHLDRLSECSVVFATSVTDAKAEYAWLGTLPLVGRLVVVTDDMPEEQPWGQEAVYLLKPFSAQGLIATIRGGLSDQPASLTQMQE